MKKNKVLVICGATATGKTKLALLLAKKFDGELIAADSRQIYKFLDIGTGKDKEQIKKSGVPIYLYDEIDPKNNFNISDYQKLAKQKINLILEKNKLPIVVGGTGFYISSIIEDIKTINIPKNDDLRKKLEEKNKEELFEMLKKLNIKKALSLNNSDKNNKRRLIRAIEIEKSGKKIEDYKVNQYEFLIIGLKTSKNELAERIKKRVIERIQNGSQKEVEDLIKNKGLSFEMQSMQTFGYQEWKDFFENKIDIDEVIKNWQKNEIKYAKRQITWFKKQKNTNWFNLNDKQKINNIEKLIEKWYY